MQTKEWTLMFYFASDNPLASTIVSQLKALKDAGYHPDANVIAHFDPHASNTPVHVFDVNGVNKFWNPGLPAIGLSEDDAFKRDLVLDRLWGEKDEKIRAKVKQHVERDMKGATFDPPKPYPRMSGEQTPKDALTNFLKFCREAYPARHYLLFILGHGQVVGNDTLLYDDNAAEHSLTLTELGQVLRCFNTDVHSDNEPGQVEMITLHSCSMSALEVAYELKGAANYMLASQGPMYVGNLPYKQILIRLFGKLKAGLLPQTNGTAKNGKPDFVQQAPESVAAFLRGKMTTEIAADLDRYLHGTPHPSKLVAAMVENVKSTRSVDEEDIAPVGTIKEMLRQMFFDCLYNSYDFQLAGYPFDLCLTDLTKVSETKSAIDALAESLIKGLEAKNPTAKHLIQMAHLDAQSFYSEDYVDLYDFCFCFRNRCDERYPDPDSRNSDETTATIYAVCKAMMNVLEKGDNNFVVRASFAGAAFQYSHGHSIFFPWKQPDDGKIWYEQYPEYRLSTETKWRQFLNVYFNETRRATRIAERKAAMEKGENLPSDAVRGQVEEDIFRREILALLGLIGVQALDAEGRLQKVGPDHPMGKYGPDDPSGATCECSSIKNYPPFTGEIETIDGEVVRIHTNEDFLEGAPLPQAMRPR